MRVPRAIAVAAWQTAAGVFVIARMNRAFPFSSMLATRTPAAREMTNLSRVAASDSCHHVQNDARLHPDQNYFRLLCDLGVLRGYRNSQLLAQRRPRDLVRLAQDDFGRRAKLRPHQAAHDRTRQLASADKAEPIPPVVGL